nr:hypothetical protein [Tanacetum cinerariifolium]
MVYFGSRDVKHEPLFIVHDVEHEQQLMLQGQPVGENPVVSLERQYKPDVPVERQSKLDVALERQSEPALERQSEPDVPINELPQPWFIRSMVYFGSRDVKHEPLFIVQDVQHEQQLMLQERQSEPEVALERQSKSDVPMFIREELLAAVKERITAIETFLKYKNEFVSGDSVAMHKEFVHKENESVDGKMTESAISCVLIGEVSGAKSVSNKFVLQQLQSRNGKLPESSLSDVLNGEFSCDINRPNEHISEEFVENELESGDGKLPESEIKKVLIGEASCDKFVPAYCNGQSLKLYYSDLKDYTSSCMTLLLQVTVPDQPSTQMVVDYSMALNLPNFNESFTESQVNDQNRRYSFDELLSENGNQLLNTTYVVDEEKYENDVHVDQSLVDQKCQEMALYLNEVNVVNENEPPSAVKRKKKAAKRLQSRKTRILFDADIDGDDDHDVMYISLEDWENTQSNKTRKRKDAIPLSEIAKSEFPLVEYCKAKCIDLETYNIKFDVEKDVPLQGDAYRDCGVWVCINLYRLIYKMSLSAKDPQIVGLVYRERSILLEKMRCSNRIYKVKDIEHDISLDWKIDISYKRDWGGRNIALKMMNGSHEDSFSHLPYYYYNLKLANEGTVTHIHTDADGRFEMLYVGFGFAIRSFLRYMRPLIIIDGAHLKRNYSRTNLLAVGMDGNNQILPLATRVSQGKKHHGIFWKACKAYTMQDFDKTISKLCAYRPEAINKLEQASIKKWSRAYCPSIHYNYMTSKSVEPINSLTRVVRRVPITVLVEYCRDLLQRWLDEERLQNGRIYMDCIDYEATEPMVSHPDNHAWTQVVEEPVTREDRGVEHWQATEWRLYSYTPYFSFLSQPDQGNIQ